MEEKIKNVLKSLRVNESLISTMLGVVVILVVGGLLYSYFKQQPTVSPDDFELTLGTTPAPVKPGEVQTGETPEGLPTTHKVEKGETLWAISERYYGSGYNLADIVSANNLSSPDDIEVGQELTIPEAPAKEQTVTEAVVEEPAQADASGSVTPPASIIGDTYVVQGSESLWDIAVRAYGDGYQWTKIYEANKTKIGRNPNKLWKDLELTIPR